MVYDPTQPEDDSYLNSAPMRENWAALQAIVGKNLAAGIDIWPSGDAADPAHWSSDTVVIARETSNVDNNKEGMAISITGDGGVGYVRQSIMEAIAAVFKGEYFSLRARVWAENTNSARVWIDDGDTKTYSDYHTGGSTYETLTVRKQFHASASTVIRFGMDTADGNEAILAQVTFVYGSVIPSKALPYETILGSAIFPFAGIQEAASTRFFWGPKAPLLVTNVALECGTAPGSALSVDLNHWDGSVYSSMFTGTYPTIATGEYSGELAPNGTYRHRCFHACHGSVITDARMAGDIDNPGTTPAEDLSFIVQGKQYNRPLDSSNASTEHGSD